MLESIYDSENLFIFDDIPPEEKDLNELIVFVLENASGTRNYIDKYNDNEIAYCVRHLISKGYLRGTIIDRNLCSWSRPTRRGLYYLELLTKLNCFESNIMSQ